uniref:Conotoxin n=1 Tax=Conus betulinus TaxID=89764 RepID=A0A142C1D6_CONBE|nr:conotoxin [Conus betulinus]
MAMNMWMTISVCVVVVMAATVVGSTPLQEQGLSLDERHNPGCCPWEFYDCLIQRMVWRSRLTICYNQASMICSRGRPGGCCPGLLHCFEECTSRDSAVCYYRCKFAPC